MAELFYSVPCRRGPGRPRKRPTPQRCTKPQKRHPQAVRISLNLKCCFQPLFLSFRAADQFTAAVRTDRIHFFCATRTKCAFVSADVRLAGGFEAIATFFANLSHF